MLIGQSPCFVACVAMLTRFAACRAAVLIQGETGTGKELAARHLHYASTRRDRPFVPVNCGAIPDALLESELFGHRRGAFTDAKTAQAGLVDLAAGGTLFFDEVDALSAKAQVSLLRFLQDFEYRPVGGGSTRVADVRIVAAANADLEVLAENGAFRRDLLYRLNSLTVLLPPLRARADDVPMLARHFLNRAIEREQLRCRRWSREAIDLLAGFRWPGNVRQLQNVTLRSAVMHDGEEIDAARVLAAEPALASTRETSESVHGTDIPGHDLRARFSDAKECAIRSFERRYLAELMTRAGGNVSRAARISGTERRHLGRLLKKHGLAQTVAVS